MKKFLVLAALSLLSISGFSQNLTLTELINLNKKAKWQQVDTYLKRKGWKFAETKTAANGKEIMWTYRKEKDSHRARAWVTLTLNNEKPSKLAYEFSSSNAFTNIKKATLILKLKESSTTNGADITTTSYTNTSNWVVLNKITGKIADKLVGAPGISYNVEIYPLYGEYDKINGVKVDKYPSGSTQSEYTLRNGLLDGIKKDYFQNGKVSATTTYSMGKKQGLASVYDEAGLLVSETMYTNDIANGDYKEYDTGKIKLVGAKANGKKEGAFVSYDLSGKITAKFTMKADSLHGRYTKNVYSNNIIKTVTGDYDNGLKSGYWETSVVNGGTKEVLEYATYRLGVKDGNFKEMDGDSLIIGSFRAGQLDGKVESYYFNPKGNNTVPVIAKADRSSVFYYSNGLMNGPYEIRDSNGIVLAKGNMANGRRDGEWTITIPTKDDTGKEVVVYHKGIYTRDIKVGEWTASTIDNVIIKKYSHKEGRIEGKITEYSWKGIPLREKIIEDGKLTQLSQYDSLGKSIVRVIKITDDNAEETRCVATTTKNDMSVICGYYIKKATPEPCNPDTFEADFTSKALNSKDKNLGGADGDYKETNSNNETIVEGKYHINSKTGKWKRYYYNMDIIITIDYNAARPTENFLDLPTGKPYSGRFIDAYSNGQIKCDKKVYSGLLDGKAKYYDQDGKMTKIETYSQGILKNSNDLERVK